jgi:myo-inositol-1(or 4)-monophosphatase
MGILPESEAVSLMQTSSSVRFEWIREWVRDAGTIALSQFTNPQIQLKSDASVVTDVDKLVESYLLKRIVRSYPSHGILAEEGSLRVGQEILWIIDPIDGTRAFASGLPVWGISVGLFHKTIPFGGVFYMPTTGDMYWGTEVSSYYNNDRLALRAGVNLQSPLAFFAVPSNAHQHYDIAFPRLRSLGSTTAHLAYVAHGIAAAALTRRVRIWDIAALLPILRASGITIMYEDGENFDPADLLDGELSRAPLVVAHTTIIKDVLALVRRKPGAP